MNENMIEIKMLGKKYRTQSYRLEGECGNLTELVLYNLQEMVEIPKSELDKLQK